MAAGIPNLFVKRSCFSFPEKLYSSVDKESTCNAGDPGSIPGSGRSTGEEKGYPLQCSGLESSLDCIVHGVAKSQTRLSDFHFHFQSFKVNRWGWGDFSRCFTPFWASCQPPGHWLKLYQIRLRDLPADSHWLVENARTGILPLDETWKNSF